MENYALVGGDPEQGSTAVVYRAVCAHTKRSVAIKHVVKPVPSPAVHETAFARRGSVVSAQHVAAPPRGLLFLHDAWKCPDGSYCIVSEACDHTLASVIDGRGIPLTDVCDVLSDIVQGLCTLATAGISHCDVSASNIMSCTRGERRTWVLIDYGLAFRSGCDTRQLAPGTPVYTAPEVARNFFAPGGAVDASRRDVYALGVVLHEMITGDMPLDVQRAEQASATMTHINVLRHVAGGSEREVAPVPDTCPRALVDLMRRMLAPDPSDRPSAHRVRDDMRTAGLWVCDPGQ